MKNPRIVLITPNFPPQHGGAQTWSLAMARGLAQRTAHLLVIAPHANRTEMVDRALPFPIQRSGMLADGFALSGFATAAATLTRFHPDLVIAAHWSAAHLPLRILPLAIPVLVAVHGREVFLKPLARFTPAQWMYDAVRRYVFGHATSCVAVSQFTAGLLRQAGVPPHQISVIGNGVDHDFYKPTDPKAIRTKLGLRGPLMLTVARLVPRKGIDRVIEALPSILPHVPDLTYIVAGDGPDLKRLQDVTQRCGVADNVRFIGSVTDHDLPALYAASNLFIMVPRSEGAEVEGFGLVYLEAGACGRPVIGSLEGGVPDAVQHERTGLLVDPHDPIAIAKAALQILTQPALATKMGEAGRLHAETWASWDRAIDAMWRLIQTKLEASNISHRRR